MNYKVVTTPTFDKAFSKLDKATQKLIKSWIINNLEGTANPRARGRGMSVNHAGYWRYRIGDYRIIADIRDSELVIVALKLGHRSIVYDDK